MIWQTIAALVSAGTAVVAAIVAIFHTAAAKDQAASARASATAAEQQAIEAQRSADAADEQVLEARRAVVAAEATLAQMKIDTSDRRRDEITTRSRTFVAASEEWRASVTALVNHVVAHGGQQHPSVEEARSRFQSAANALIVSASELMPFFGQAQTLHEPYGDFMLAVQVVHSAMQVMTIEPGALSESTPAIVAIREAVDTANSQAQRFQTQLIRWLTDFSRVDLGLPQVAS